MTITNGYCTLAEFKAEKRVTSTDATDDGVIEGLIEDASRLIDAITGRHFYAMTTMTRVYDVPPDGVVWLDEDLLVLTTLTNGDGTAISSANYVLRPDNRLPKFLIQLRDVSGLGFYPSSTTGSYQQAISILGTWGYCDRASSDADSVTAVRNTRQACIEIAVHNYQQRFGQVTEGNVQVTAAGLVITPHGAIPKAAYERIRPYIKAV